MHTLIGVLTSFSKFSIQYNQCNNLMAIGFNLGLMTWIEIFGGKGFKFEYFFQRVNIIGLKV